ncbi:AsmA family protein, partial [Stenotrophomonas sp.]
MNTVPSPVPSDAPSRSRWRWRRPGKRGQRWLAILVFLFAALLILIALWDWNWFKGPVERAVQAKTGREFHITGDLDVDLGRVTTLRGDGLTFANATWAKQPQMATADRVEIDLRVWPLLRGQVRIPEIRLTRPDLLLETAPEKNQPGNWDFLGPSDGDPPVLQRLLVDDGRLQFRDAAGRTDVLVSLDSGKPRDKDSGPPLLVKGKGRWQGNPFSLEGNTESPLELTNTGHPFRIHLDGRAGNTHAIASGTLTNPFQLRVFNLELMLSGQDME